MGNFTFLVLFSVMLHCTVLVLKKFPVKFLALFPENFCDFCLLDPDPLGPLKTGSVRFRIHITVVNPNKIILSPYGIRLANFDNSGFLIEHKNLHIKNCKSLLHKLFLILRYSNPLMKREQKTTTNNISVTVLKKYKSTNSSATQSFCYVISEKYIFQ